MALASASLPKATSTPGSKKARPAATPAAHASREQSPHDQGRCSCGGGCPKCREPKLETNANLETEAHQASDHYQAIRRAAGTISSPGRKARPSKETRTTSSPRPPTRRWRVSRSSVPDRSLGEGRALEKKSREDFEAFFEADFCAIRLHTGPPAESLAARYGTQALAFGNHIILSDRAPPLDSHAGIGLLVHELTHCLQQSGTRANFSNPDIHDHPGRAPPVTRLGGPVIQGFDIELPTLADVGNAVSNAGDAAWDTAAEVGGAAVEFAGEQLETVVNTLAPGLLAFINGGLGSQITELFCSGIDALMGALLSPLEDLDIVSTVESTFTSLGQGVQSMWSGLGKGASATLGLVLRPLVEALKVFDGPVIKGMTAGANTVQGIFSGLWNHIGVPVLDFLQSVGGSIWTGFQNIFKWLDRITKPLRTTAAAIWRKLMARFNLAWGSTSDMRKWISDTAAKAWKKFLKTIEPIKTPLMIAGGVLLMFTPFGPIIILTQVIPPLWDKLVWLWNNWNTKDILVKAKDILANDILPSILGVISGVSLALASAVSWLGSMTREIAKSLSKVLSAFGLSKCLKAVTRILDHVSGEFEDLAEWAEGGFKGLGDAIEAVFNALVAIFQPILDFLVRLLIVAANPPLLPIAITAVIWLLCPDDLKPPVINFVLDFLIQALRALPTFMPGLWPMASLMKGAALGFMGSLRIQSDQMKIAASNKIAGLMAGGGLQFIAGFAVGLLRGIIDGILDPFRIIWMLIRLTVAVCRALGTVIARLSSTVAGIGSKTRQGLGLKAPAKKQGIGGAFLSDLGFGAKTPSPTNVPPAHAGAGPKAPAATPVIDAQSARGPPAQDGPPKIVSHENNPEFARLTGIRPPSGPTTAARNTATLALNKAPPAPSVDESTGSASKAGQSVDTISTTTSFSPIEIPTSSGPGSESAPEANTSQSEGDANPLADLIGQGPLPSDADVVASLSSGSGQELLGAAGGLQGAGTEAETGFGESVQTAGASPRSLAGFLGDAWDAAISGATNLGASMAEALLGFILLPDYQLGNKLGFVTGFVLFQLILAYFTAGISTAASGLSPTLKLVMRFLDLGGEIIGLAGRALARLAAPIGKLLAAGGKLLGRIPGVSGIFNRFAGALHSLMRIGGEAASATLGAARKVTDPLGEAAMKAAGFAPKAIDNVMGHTGREIVEEGAGQAATKGAQAASREGAETAGAKAAREAEESAAGKAGREAEENAAGKAGQETGEGAAKKGDEATKAAEMGAAESLARGICEANDLIYPSPHPALVIVQLVAALSRYRWIDTFGYDYVAPRKYRIYFTASPKHYTDDDYSTDNVLPADRDLTKGLPPLKPRPEIDVPQAPKAPTRTTQGQDLNKDLGLGDLRTKNSPGGAMPQTRKEVGNFAHHHAEDLHTFADDIVPDRMPQGPHIEAEVRIPMQNGDNLRADRVDWENGIVYEIKPAHGNWPAKGQAQAQTYASRLDKIEPRPGGEPWRAEVLTYNLDELEEYLFRIGFFDPALRKAKGPAPPRRAGSLDQAVSEPGEPLPRQVAEAAAESLGPKAADARIHRSQTAQMAAEQSNAEAVTLGHHILLGRQASDLNRESAHRTLAHELHHVANPVAGASHAAFEPEHSASELLANEAESKSSHTLFGQGKGGGGTPPSESNSKTPEASAKEARPADNGGATAAPPAVASLTSNLSNTRSDLAHVPPCGNQPTIRFTSGPAKAAPVQWSLAAGTAVVAAGTALTPAANTLTADLSLGTAQTGGNLTIAAENDSGGQETEFPLASHPTGIKSTSVIGDPGSTTSYGGVFDHEFTSHDSQVASLETVGVGERFPSLPDPDTASHTFATPFGEFTLHTGTLPDAASGASGNWFLTSDGELGGTHDTVSIAKSMIDIGRHLVSDSNPTPTHPLPAESVINQDFHWWCPHGATGKRWTKFASTTHTRRLEIDSNGNAVFKAVVNSEKNVMDYDGTTGVRNAVATPSSATASVPDQSAHTVEISAEAFPSDRDLHFSIRGAAHGSTIDAETGVLTIGQQTGTVKVRAADSHNGKNWDEVDLTISAASTPSTTPPEENEANPMPTPPDDNDPPGTAIAPRVPGSSGGRSLPGPTDFAHFGHGQGGGNSEPHYPSVSEQKRIQGIMGRNSEPTSTSKPTEESATPQAVIPETAEPEITERGKSLNEKERTAMVKELEAPFLSSLRTLVAQSGGTENTSTISETDALREVERARAAVYKKFGSYLTQATNLTTDASLSVKTRRKADQLLVNFADMSKESRGLVNAMLFNHCNTCRTSLAALNDESKDAVVGAFISKMITSHGKEISQAAGSLVGGSYSSRSHRINLPLTYRHRASYFATIVHELIHSLTHPAFDAAFGDERNIDEGFTEYFARQIAPTTFESTNRDGTKKSHTRTSYQDSVELVQKVRSSMGSSSPGLTWTGKSPEESLRRAYFEGDLELIGWRPSGSGEQDEVEAAGGSEMWDPDEAETQETVRRTMAQQQQNSHSNMLGVGLFFSSAQNNPFQIAVRYTRVLAESNPYSRHRFLGEAQAVGSPVSINDAPRALGGSIGLAYEYQEPWFYLGGGARFIGSAVPDEGTHRLDISPFLGAGIRAWQVLRVGAEGFVLFPITPNDHVAAGIGGTLSVEF